MGKLGFWVAVVAVAIIGIYLFKMAAASLPVPGLQSFAQSI
jgi:hypothetical protein